MLAEGKFSARGCRKSDLRWRGRHPSHLPESCALTHDKGGDAKDDHFLEIRGSNGQYSYSSQSSL